MNKIIYWLLITVAVLVLLGLAFFAFNSYIYNEKQGSGDANSASTVELTGVVSEIDLAPVMVDGPARITISTTAGETAEIDIPSMGIQLCSAKENITAPQLLFVGDIVEVKGQLDEEGIVVPCVDQSHYFKVTGVMEDKGLNLKFNYPKGQSGYVLQTGLREMSVDPDFITGYILTLETDAAELADSEEPRDGAPTIQIRIYDNPNKQQPGNWAESHPLESNIELAFGAKEEAVVGGANAVSYTADGLYASKVYVAAHNNFIYVFTASYVDESSPTLRDFQSLLNSVEFIAGNINGGDSAPSGVSGKIRADVFTGVLEVVHTGCLADTECFVMVDGKKVTIERSSDDDIVGKVIGVDEFSDMEDHVGETVEVYAQDFADGTYTLYGSEGFYLKLVAEDYQSI